MDGHVTLEVAGEWNSLVIKVTALTGKADLSQSTEREEQKTQALTLHHSEAGGSYGVSNETRSMCVQQSQMWRRQEPHGETTKGTRPQLWPEPEPGVLGHDTEGGGFSADAAKTARPARSRKATHEDRRDPTLTSPSLTVSQGKPAEAH